jgi:hypothetical protein
MTRHLSIPLVACLLVAGLAAPLHAEALPADVETQVLEIYKKLGTILLGGDSTQRATLVLANPGLPLSTTFDQENQDQMEVLDDLADIVPQPLPFYVKSTSTFSRVYEDILANRQPVNPPTPLTPAEAKERADKLGLLEPGSKTWKDYKKFRDAYWEARAELEDAQMAGRKNLTQLQAAVGDAKAEWESPSLGHKVEVEGAMERLRQLDARDGNAWWGLLRRRFDAEVRGTHHRVAVFPGPGDWDKREAASSSTWTRVTFKAGEKIDENSLKSEEIKVSLHGKNSGVSVDFDFSKVDREFASLFAKKDLEMTLDVKRVDISRPWLDDAVFTNTGWKFTPAAGTSSVVSYGDLKRNQQNRVALPLVVTSFLLVKNLTIKASLTQDQLAEFKHAIDMEAAISAFGFTLSGGYHKMDAGKKAKSTVTQTGFTCPGLQIIGFVCSVPAKSPASTTN